MNMPIAKHITTALLGGCAAGVFAPLLWPLIVLAFGQSISIWGLSGLLAVAFFAAILGLIAGAVLALPILLLMEKLKIKNQTPLFAGGAIAGSIAATGLQAPIASGAPLYVFGAVVGLLCALVMSRRFRSNDRAL